MCFPILPLSGIGQNVTFSESNNARNHPNRSIDPNPVGRSVGREIWNFQSASKLILSKFWENDYTKWKTIYFQ